MLQIPENVRHLLVQLLPASILNELTCYVFYDGHPRDEKKIDITVCTKMGEVREYFKRDLISSINLGRTPEASEIRILRNSKCDLFYLVAISDEIIILSRKDKLEIQHILTHVYKYEILDEICSGKATLKVETGDSDLPLVLDDNFENFIPLDFILPRDDKSVDVDSPAIKHLMRKVVESKHIADCLNKSYKEFLQTRHSISFAMYKKLHPDLDDSIFKYNPGLISDSLKICFKKSWIKSCNKNIVIAYNICNNNQEPLECVQIVLHGTMRPSLEYTTKIFEKITEPPFWKETDSQTLKPYVESALVVVMSVMEINDNILSKTEFNGAIVFKKTEVECTLQIEDIILSPLDTMGEEFDALSTESIDDNVMLAILASTERTDLLMRQITQASFADILREPLSIEIFCKYLQMERAQNTENIVLFKKSPYHLLNGVMIIMTKEWRNQLEITVHSRSPEQILALIHLVQDTVPITIVITTPNYVITAKDSNLLINNANVTSDNVPYYNYNGYLTSILNRTAMVLEYLNNSMIKMSESKNVMLQNKIGKEIDIFAQGEDKYKEFKEKMWAEAEKGVKSLNKVIETECLSPSDDYVNMEL